MTTAEQAKPAAGFAQTDIIYMVVAGDRLSTIANRFYGDPMQYPRIAQANGIDPTVPLKVGQRLRVLGAHVTAAPAAPTATAKVPTPATQVVQPGFTALSLSDWRVWAGVGLVGLALYLLTRKSR